MSRARISTTVDAEQLKQARQLLRVSDSELFDRALEGLVARLVAEHELAALTALPYEDDPDVAWTAASGPDLPYGGEVPSRVRELAKRRRALR